MAKKTKMARATTEPSASMAMALPQVDLLPPEIREGRRFKVRQRKLGITILGVLVVALLLIVGFWSLKGQAENRLAQAEDTAQDLQQQKKQYSSVTGILKSISDTKDVRDFSLTTEVNWSRYIQAISAVLPAGVTIDTFDIVQVSLTSSATAASDPVLAGGLGTLTFVARSPTIPEASDWSDALDGVPGFQDASIQSVSLDTAEAGDKESYTVNATVQFNSLALANRVFEDSDPAADGAKTSQEEAK